MKRKTPKAVSDKLISALAGEAPEVSEESETPTPEVTPVEPTPEASDKSPVAEPTPVVSTETTGLVAHLKEELQNSRTENTKLITENAKLQIQLDSAKTELIAAQTLAEGCSEAIRQMTQRLSIGLGKAIAGLENLSGENLLSQWSKVKTEFDTRFVSNGRASSEASETGVTQPEATTQQRRAIKATSLR